MNAVCHTVVLTCCSTYDSVLISAEARVCKKFIHKHVLLLAHKADTLYTNAALVI